MKKIISSIIVCLMLCVMSFGFAGCDGQGNNAYKLEASGSTSGGAVWTQEGVGKTKTQAEYKDEILANVTITFTVNGSTEEVDGGFSALTWEQFRAKGGTCTLDVTVSGAQSVVFRYKGHSSKTYSVTMGTAANFAEAVEDKGEA